MPRTILNKIREAARTGDFDLTYQAVEEMAEDFLGIEDVENVLAYGKISKKEYEGIRGVKYVLEGVASDQ